MKVVAIGGPEPQQAPPRLLVPAPLLFAVIFSIVWLMHAPLLRLPYFWDESGYYIPAAHDLLAGHLIPTTTLTTAHPPLLMAWLAFWWKFSKFTPAVTRTAMLLVSAFALLGVFRLARQVSNVHVAIASTALTALFPVFFVQSSLAHLDMMAAAFTLWGLASYLKRHFGRATIWFALAGISKETALIAPLALVAWEALLYFRFKFSDAPTNTEKEARNRLKALVLFASLLPLSAWLAYHYSRTGHVFGNPDYFRYNVSATLNPLRFLLALLQRLWQLLGYLNMFVLTGAAAFAMRYRPLHHDGEERPRIDIGVQLVFGVVIVVYVLMLAAVGGAVLARYLVPVYPLVIILCVATLWRRMAGWQFAAVAVAAAFVIGLFITPPYRIAPEDNLTYADFVHLHKDAVAKLATLPEARVLTAWPATDELQRSYLGYVSQPIPVEAIENFTLSQLMHARQRESRYNYALVFSSKYEPAFDISGSWWEQLQTRFFDYHRDLSPENAAELLGGRIIWTERRGAEWVAIIEAGTASQPQNAKAAEVHRSYSGL